MADGLTSKAIAGRLGISESTVNWHLANALRKLGASSRAAAVAAAMRDGTLGSTTRPPEAIPARELRRWQVMLAAVMTLMLATPLVIAAALLTVRDRAGEPMRTDAPARSAPASAVPTARTSSTVVPSVSTPPPVTASPPTGGRLPRSVPVVPKSTAPAATASYVPTTPPVTPAIQLPLPSPALGTPALPVLGATPAPSLPALPSVPSLPSVPTLPSLP